MLAATTTPTPRHPARLGRCPDLCSKGRSRPLRRMGGRSCDAATDIGVDGVQDAERASAAFSFTTRCAIHRRDARAPRYDIVGAEIICTGRTGASAGFHRTGRATAAGVASRRRRGRWLSARRRPSTARRGTGRFRDALDLGVADDHHLGGGASVARSVPDLETGRECRFRLTVGPTTRPAVSSTRWHRQAARPMPPGLFPARCCASERRSCVPAWARRKG